MTWLLLSVSIILAIFLFNEKRNTKIIAGKLKEILKEDSRERIKLNNLSTSKKNIVKQINILLDRYQKISIDNRNYNEQHKKMISNISHDIRTPLTALKGYIHLLMDNNLQEQKKAEYINIIYERSDALVELMEEFFQMAKLECDDVNINIEKINLSEVIRQNLITYLNEINEKKLDTKINLGEEEVFALCDKTAINRVISNLISNSLKYGYEGNVIGIDLKVYEKGVQFTVWDKGKGISEDQLPFIFDRLYTAEKSRNRKLQGSGLGLSIVKKLVKSMNGNIEVKSIPFEKTSFIVTLPTY